MTKVCTKCNKAKDLSEFRAHPKGKHGTHAWCKDCAAEYSRKYYATHTEQCQVRSTNYLLLHPDKVLRGRFVAFAKLLGIGVLEVEQFYNRKIVEQDGCCAICHRNVVELGRRLCIDHDHKTNRLRGLLCISCNRGIGYLQDNAALCDQAKTYLLNERD